MTALLKYEQPIAREIVDYGFADAELFFLNKMRMIAMRCRSSARLDHVEACRLVADLDDRNEEIAIEAMLRTMRQSMNKPPVFMTPNTSELSFDEAWLLRCVCATKDGDHMSARFLLARRVEENCQKSMRFLLARVSEYLSRI